MQTEVPALPIVQYSQDDKNLTRKVRKGIVGLSPRESKNNKQCNNTTSYFLTNRKQYNSILGGPYRDSLRMNCHSEPVARISTTCKNLLGQRIISAKILRVKELQNQLSDAHYHLNELANENRLLKALQKRQDSALKRYEGTNAELPRIINSHQDELKALQTKYKQLKLQHKQTCDLLKEKECDIHSLQSQNKHLLKLSKDQQLGEREKLQIQVSDLNHEIQQQHNTIQTLNRKLTLESKKFKHQISMEVTRHRDTQKQLKISLEKLKTLEDLLSNREKRLYCNSNGHQLSLFNRREPRTSQSLTNLRNNSLTSNFVKSANNNRNSHNDRKNETLPKLNMKESNDTGKLIIMETTNTLDIINASETMASLDHIRKFRLQKSSRSRHSSPYASDENEMRDKIEIETDTIINNCKTNAICKSIDIKNIRDNNEDIAQDDNELEDINKYCRNTTNINKEYRIPEKLMRDVEFLSSNSDLSDDDSHKIDEIPSPTSNSKHLHSRLINATINGTNTDEDKFNLVTMKKLKIQNDNFHKSNLLNISEKINDNRLNDHDNINDDNEKMSLDEFSHLNIDEVAPNLSNSTKQSSQYNRNKQINLQKNSTNKSCDESNTDNNESFASGSNLWTRLREKLNKVQIDCDNSQQSEIVSPRDGSVIKNNLPINLKLERKNSETSYELLNYFDIKRNNDESSDKLSTSETDNDHSHVPIINDLNLNMVNNVMINDKINCDLSVTSDDNTNDKMGENITHIQQYKNDETPSDMATINFNKQKLLDAMKAIDDNDNIEYRTDKKLRESNNFIRSQVTENLYRGLPTHAKKRDEIIKDIFSDTKISNKLHSGCSKLH